MGESLFLDYYSISALLIVGNRAEGDEAGIRRQPARNGSPSESVC
jgi:hypothetical protein